MLGLKTRRKPQVTEDRSDWPVVDGEPVKPYELPDDPVVARAVLDRMNEDARRRREQERTQFSRGVRRVADDWGQRRGSIIWSRTFFRRWTATTRRSGTTLRLQVMPAPLARDAGKWELSIDLWRE